MQQRFYPEGSIVAHLYDHGWGLLRPDGASQHQYQNCTQNHESHSNHRLTSTKHPKDQAARNGASRTCQRPPNS